MKNKKHINLIISCLIILLLITGCSKQEDEVEAPQLTTEQEIVLNFNALLNDSNEPSLIGNYLDTHIESVSIPYRDTMILNYESFLNSKLPESEDKLTKNLADYSLFVPYLDYLSDELSSYISIMNTESSDPLLSSNIQYDKIDEILKRSIEVEKHLLLFNGGFTENKMYELYVRYLYASIFGNGNPLAMANPNTSLLNNEIYNSYLEFIENYPNEKTTILISDYLDLLDKSKLNLENETIQNFYYNFYSSLRSALWQSN